MTCTTGVCPTHGPGYGLGPWPDSSFQHSQAIRSVTWAGVHRWSSVQHKLGRGFLRRLQVAYGTADLVVVLIVGVREDFQEGTVRLESLGGPFEGGLVLGLDLFSSGDQLSQ